MLFIHVCKLGQKFWLKMTEIIHGFVRFPLLCKMIPVPSTVTTKSPSSQMSLCGLRMNAVPEHVAGIRAWFARAVSQWRLCTQVFISRTEECGIDSCLRRQMLMCIATSLASAGHWYQKVNIYYFPMPLLFLKQGKIPPSKGWRKNKKRRKKTFSSLERANIKDRMSVVTNSQKVLEEGWGDQLRNHDRNSENQRSPEYMAVETRYFLHPELLLSGNHAFDGDFWGFPKCEDIVGKFWLAKCEFLFLQMWDLCFRMFVKDQLRACPFWCCLRCCPGYRLLLFQWWRTYKLPHDVKIMCLRCLRIPEVAWILCPLGHDTVRCMRASKVVSEKMHGDRSGALWVKNKSCWHKAFGITWTAVSPFCCHNSSAELSRDSAYQSACLPVLLSAQQRTEWTWQITLQLINHKELHPYFPERNNNTQ